jgi:hypothetical protein
MNTLLKYIPIYGVWKVCRNNYEELPDITSIHYTLTAFAHAIYIVAILMALLFWT